MRQIGLEEQKQIQLSILDDIDRFCTANGLNYSLCGGTMLGAVRHQGYIPWDDDIDLMMPRTDYERFKESYRSKDNQIIDLSAMDTCVEQFLKVSRKGTQMEDVVLKRRLWGVNVDVFPIDGMPEDFKAYTDYLRRTHDTITEICPYYKAAGKNRLYWQIRYFIKRMARRTDGDILHLKSELNDLAMAHLPEHSPLSTVIYGDFKVFPFPTDLFFNLNRILFEGKTYMCISDTDLYLRTVYGDYMQLPPEEKQITHHLYNAYIED